MLGSTAWPPLSSVYQMALSCPFESRMAFSLPPGVKAAVEVSNWPMVFAGLMRGRETRLKPYDGDP